jgi:5'-3' exoribonuclease 1
MLPEIDNFYLDMNGIIHAYTHANGTETSVKLSLRDMVLAIFRYIDRCVSGIVKPKKLLSLAIDGVAPRAKLINKDLVVFAQAKKGMFVPPLSISMIPRSENLMKAQQRGEEIDESTMFDSNCITPGTEFMEIIDKHLRYFIRKKIKEDPLWRDLEVIYSGHDVPGEGEHKIMQYIREAREKPNYQPNIRHCLYGQDADLIMLGLATHQPHFTLLREVVDFGSGRNFNSKRDTVMKQTKVKFQLLHLSVLREYIEVDFAQHHKGEPRS